MMASGKNAKKSRAKAPVVTSRQGLPWLTIVAVVAILALIGGIFFVVLNKKSDNDAAAADVSAAQSSVAAAGAEFVPSATNQDPSTKIEGIFVGKSTPGSNGGPATYPEYDNRVHVTSDQRVAYDRFPPIGGPHDQTWAACNGVAYAKAVRIENMVHTLEHGAVWIAYNPDTISASDLTTLKNIVTGQPYITLAPYPGLDATISLQAWAHQLKVDSATDPRIGQFITALRLNPYVYPETGATCDQPTFDVENPPAFDTTPVPADAVPMSGDGATGATMSGDAAATGSETAGSETPSGGASESTTTAGSSSKTSAAASSTARSSG
jgi:hypothetical protein